MLRPVGRHKRIYPSCPQHAKYEILLLSLTWLLLEMFWVHTRHGANAQPCMYAVCVVKRNARMLGRTSHNIHAPSAPDESTLGALNNCYACLLSRYCYSLCYFDIEKWLYLAFADFCTYFNCYDEVNKDCCKSTQSTRWRWPVKRINSDGWNGAGAWSFKQLLLPLRTRLRDRVRLL